MTTEPVETTALAVREAERAVAEYQPLTDADLENTLAEWRLYQKACRMLLDDEDSQGIGKGKSFKKKSAWRKLGKFFKVTTTIVDHSDPEDPDVKMHWFIVRATEPGGRSTEAWGGCSRDEREFSKRQDQIAQAQTRATNRAIADLIGAGEVSYEEAQGNQAQHYQPAPDRGNPRRYDQKPGKVQAKSTAPQPEPEAEQSYYVEGTLTGIVPHHLPSAYLTLEGKNGKSITISYTDKADGAHWDLMQIGDHARLLVGSQRPDNTYPALHIEDLADGAQQDMDV